MVPGKKIPFGLVLSGFILALTGIIILIAFLFQGQDARLDKELPTQENRLENSLLQLEEMAAQIKIGGQSLNTSAFIDPDRISSALVGSFSSVMSGVGVFLSEFLLVVIFLIFIMPSHDRILKNIQKSLLPKNAKAFRSIVFQIERSIMDYLVTKTLISLGTAIASAIVLFLFGAKLVILFGFIIFALNYIPNIGSFVAVIAALISYTLTYGVGWPLLWLAVLLITIQFVFGNILEPKFAGQKLSLSPIVILLGLFLWAWIWGVAGMLLAVPLISVMKIILSYIPSTKRIADMMS